MLSFKEWLLSEEKKKKDKKNENVRFNKERDDVGSQNIQGIPVGGDTKVSNERIFTIDV
jgi:hypothetical protein